MIGSKGTFLASACESGHWHFKSIFLEIPGFLQRSFPAVKLQLCRKIGTATCPGQHEASELGTGSKETWAQKFAQKLHLIRKKPFFAGVLR